MCNRAPCTYGISTNNFSQSRLKLDLLFRYHSKSLKMFPFTSLLPTTVRVLTPISSCQIKSNLISTIKYSISSQNQQKQTQNEATIAKDKASRSSPFGSIITKRRKINGALKDTIENLPTRPKRPYTPWVAFVLERKDSLLRNEKMTAVELSIKLAEEWKNTDKSRYLEDYQRRVEEFKRQLEEFDNNITDSDRDLIELKGSLMRQRKSINQLGRTNPPKLPANPANIYLRERFKDPEVQERLKTNRVGTLFKQMFDEYRTLTPEQKEKYIKMREEDRIRFINEFNKWYEATKNDKNLNKMAKKQAESMYARVKAMYFI